MRMGKQKVLIGAEVDGAKATDELRLVSKYVDEHLTMLAVSSIYGDHKLLRNENLNNYMGKNLRACFSVLTNLEPKALNQLLAKLQSQINLGLEHCSVKLSLLAYENMSTMRPSLTLPHPDLVEAKTWLVPSAEIWPQFLHPILNDELKLLVKKQVSEIKVEFFAQGKCLLDF